MNLPSVRTDRATARRRSRGQVVVIFAGAMLAFIGLMAIVIDISWYWASSLRVQRAADAAALAGVVWLPGDYAMANTTARTEATKNGYTAGVNGVAITTQQDPSNDRRLIVVIAAPVPTFFARVVGLNSIMSIRTSFAEFVLPVPMGSPENYYGTFGIVRNATTTIDTSVTNQKQTSWNDATTRPSGGWTNPGNADSNNNNSFAVSPKQNAALASRQQQWQTYGLTFTGAVNSIDGIEVRMNELLSGSGGAIAGCEIGYELSWINGTTWTTPQKLSITSNTVEATITTGAINDLWGHSPWTTGQLADAQLRLRLTWMRTGNNTTCADNRTLSVDTLEVRVTYTSTVTGTSMSTTNNNIGAPNGACANGAANCFAPTGGPLNARGFWATMNTEGASNINGDAHQPYYDNATSNVANTCPSSTNQACYDPPKTGTSGQNVGSNYYNYAIEMPPGSTNGKVYIFDPSFCATDHASGTGDRWFGGSSAVNSYYDIYNTNGTLYTLLDDTLVKGTGTTFTGMDGTDSTMGGGNSGSECMQTGTGIAAYGDYRDYHDSWYLLNPANLLSGSGPTGTIYRLHTTGTNPANVAQQRGTNAEQSFSIYASATGGAPKIYGLGAMQMFTPLSSGGGSTSSEFYLAQVPAIHAGKTIEIGLWDPGDTNPLSASLQIEIPSATIGVWTPTNFTWTATKGTTSGLNSCNGTVHPNVGSVTTATPTSQFNGCWLTIDVPIPSNYAGYQQGWWKIKYTMTGNGTSDDVTTWTAVILGNPVHLVLP